MEQQRGRDLQTPYELKHASGEARILSVEIDPGFLFEVPTEVNEGRLHIDAHTIKKIKLHKEK